MLASINGIGRLIKPLKVSEPIAITAVEADYISAGLEAAHKKYCDESLNMGSSPYYMLVAHRFGQERAHLPRRLSTGTKVLECINNIHRYQRPKTVPRTRKPALVEIFMNKLNEVADKLRS